MHSLRGADNFATVDAILHQEDCTMAGWFSRAFFSATIGLGVMAGLLRAQTPTPTTMPPTVITQAPTVIAQVPTAMTAPAALPIPPYNTTPLNSFGAPPADPNAPRRPCKDWMKKHGLCCFTTFNGIGCGSLAS